MCRWKSPERVQRKRLRRARSDEEDAPLKEELEEHREGRREAPDESDSVWPWSCAWRWSNGDGVGVVAATSTANASARTALVMSCWRAMKAAISLNRGTK